MKIYLGTFDIKELLDFEYSHGLLSYYNIIKDNIHHKQLQMIKNKKNGNKRGATIKRRNERL